MSWRISRRVLFDYGYDLVTQGLAWHDCRVQILETETIINSDTRFQLIESATDIGHSTLFTIRTDDSDMN